MELTGAPPRPSPVFVGPESVRFPRFTSRSASTALNAKTAIAPDGAPVLAAELVARGLLVAPADRDAWAAVRFSFGGVSGTRANLAALLAASRAHAGEVVAARDARGTPIVKAACGGADILGNPARWILTAGPLPAGGGPRAVLLDRDGTLIEDRTYLNDPDGVRLLPGVLEGLRALSDQDYRLVVVTNQSGIARGFVTPVQLEAIHARLRECLAEGGVRLSGIYACPHDAAERCQCRKPAAGLALRAAAELGLDLSGGLMVGDKAADLELGHRLGIPAVLVSTGSGRETLTSGAVHADYLVDDMAELARITGHPDGIRVVEPVA